ncbi:hypothetical protein [Sorangium atrum]|uniref:Uncharacterized protein n=1 Tax=Sorangium atrum TaxID=2995308 RepID=A0ABT5BZL8_9BACT|nr:hypothetical protein [Sorangium aterium]MDC0679603.1 hypothetical protein [Sorangium aterium]
MKLVLRRRHVAGDRRDERLGPRRRGARPRQIAVQVQRLRLQDVMVTERHHALVRLARGQVVGLGGGIRRGAPGPAREVRERELQPADDVDRDLVLALLVEVQKLRQIREHLREGPALIQLVEQLVDENIARVPQLPGLEPRLVSSVVDRLGRRQGLHPR